MAKINVRDRNKNIPDRKPNWEYRFEAAKIDGKRKSISKAGFRTKKDALEAGTKALAEYNNSGIHFEPSEISVNDYFDYWNTCYVIKNLAYNSQVLYDYYIETFIKPYFGKYKLKNLSPASIQDYADDLKNRKFSKSLTKGVLAMMQTALRYAVHPLGYIKDNPMENIIIKLPKFPSRKRIALTLDNFEDILNLFPPGNRYHIPILLGWYCGLRISEACALTWDDINFDAKTININKQLLRRSIKKNLHYYNKLNQDKDNPKGWYFIPPKYDSYREIRISDNLMIALQQEKERQIKESKERCGHYFVQVAETEIDEKGEPTTRIITVQRAFTTNEHKLVNFICIDSDGKLTNTETFGTASKKIKKNLNLPFDYHTLRHTHATLLIEKGVNVKTVSARLGHKNISTTLQKYVHDTEEMQETAIDVLNEFDYGMKNVHSTQ